MLKNKKHKITLLMYENFDEEIQRILINDNINYTIFLYFSSNMKRNIQLLEKSKKFFFNVNSDEFMKNIFIFSQREFLANDLLVNGVITPKNIEKFDYFKFITLYEQGEYSGIEEFLWEKQKEFEYSLDMYEKDEPWLYYKNRTGVLVVSEKTYDKILENYHKVKFFIPEVIVTILGNENDELLINILKLIGADAHIILGIINKLIVPYTKRTDAYIFIPEEEYANIGQEFIDKLLEIEEYPIGLTRLREFLKIPEKNFEADMTYDEEREIERKEKKYYELNIEKGSSLKREIQNFEKSIILNVGLKKKYVLSILEKNSI